MTSSNASALLATALLLVAGHATGNDWQFGGHTRYQFNASHYADSNLVTQSGFPTTLDHYLDVRLKAERRQGSWQYQVHHEILGLYGDSAELLAGLPSLPLSTAVPDDSSRLFNLTQAFGDGNRLAGVHRLDRLVASYAGDRLAARFGRQAISWGNGLVFNPMDLVSPFSPTAISKEYKTGDDMAYFQWLFATGDDIQGILLPRRTNSGNLDPAASSLALKYRGNTVTLGYDLLLAQHYDESVVGIGLSSDVGGAVVRSDLVHAWLASGDNVVSAVLNASYSWNWGKHNVSGNAEYYRNGVGNAAGDYSSAFIVGTPLSNRIGRGEVFGLGRDYLATSLAIEMTPRLVMSPTWIHNLNDGSGMLQTLFNYDWKPDAPLAFGFGLPYGAPGSEYGGVDTGTPGQFYGPGVSVFFLAGYYF